MLNSSIAPRIHLFASVSWARSAEFAGQVTGIHGGLQNKVQWNQHTPVLPGKLLPLEQHPALGGCRDTLSRGNMAACVVILGDCSEQNRTEPQTPVPTGRGGATLENTNVPSGGGGAKLLIFPQEEEEPSHQSDIFYLRKRRSQVGKFECYPRKKRNLVTSQTIFTSGRGRATLENTNVTTGRRGA